jgi:hypothetical protein
MPVNGRLKGKAFEREVAEEIREIFGYDKNEIFRTPNSGGFANTQRSDISIREDILVSEFPVSIECKWYKDWSLAKMVQLTATEKSWHLQCLASSALTVIQFQKRKPDLHLLPILVCKGNNRDPWAFSPQWHGLGAATISNLVAPYLAYLYEGELWAGAPLDAYLTSLKEVLSASR